VTHLIKTATRFIVKFLGLSLSVSFTFYTSLIIANDDIAGLPLAQIIVEGNAKTQTRFVLKWAKISVGDSINQIKLDQTKQNLLDTELFKEVILRTEMRQSKPTLIIQLKEKYYTLLLPRLSRNGDGDIKLGVNLKLFNINGANQKLNLLVEKSELNNGDDGRRYRINYDFPQFNHPYRYHISVSDSVKNTKTNDFRNIEYENIASISLTRDWPLLSFNYPLSITTSLTYQNIYLKSAYPELLGKLDAGKYSRLGFKVEYDAVHSQQYRRYGYFHSLDLQQGIKWVGSDHTSSIIKIESRFYRPLNQLDNFNSRLLFGWSSSSPFNVPYYELGGSSTLRGLEQESIEGDALVLGNFEYIKGFENYPSFRLSSFIDVGNVYEDITKIDLIDLQTSVGFGGRWKLTSFVKTDLFVDYAYNKNTHNSRVYGGTSLTF